MMQEEEQKRPDSIAGDRRSDKRYELHLELRWKLIRRRRVLDTGVGRTLDLSSGGILFDAGRPLPAGFNVELSISWPMMLHNVAPLQLVICGRIMRSKGNQIAIRKTLHEFRTAGVSPDHRAALATASRTPGALLGSFSSASEVGKVN